MTRTKLSLLIAEAVGLDRRIRQDETRLKEIKEALKAEAATRQEEHAPTTGGGWSWTAEAADGCICRVTQEGAKLKSSISSEKEIARLKETCGSCGPAVFHQLFEPSVVYKPAQGIRETAAGLMGKAAAKLLKLITTAGMAKVAFETKDAA